MTTEWNGRYMMETNYRYSVELLEYCLAKSVPLIYASSAAVYGASTVFKENDARGRAAAERLRLLEAAVRRVRAAAHAERRARGSKRRAPVVGLRYFNVYGPGEAHKGSMASVAFHLHGQVAATGEARLFEGSGGYAAGRAAARFRARRRRRRREPLVLRAREGLRRLQRRHGRERDVQRGREARSSRGTARAPSATSRFQTSSKSRYQSFTEADITALRAAGYSRPFRDVRAGIKDYLDALGARP